MALRPFAELLGRLAECHEQALDDLRQDNVQLAQEVYRLKSGRPRDSRPLVDTAIQVGSSQEQLDDLTVQLLENAPDVPGFGRHGFPARFGVSAQPEHQSHNRCAAFNRHSFPAQIGGPEQVEQPPPKRSSSDARWHSEPDGRLPFDRNTFHTLTGVPTELARQSSHRFPEQLCRSMSEVSSLAKFVVGVGTTASGSGKPLGVTRAEGGVRINFTPVIHEPSSISGETVSGDLSFGLPNEVAPEALAVPSRQGGMGRGSSAILEKAVADRHSQNINKQQQHFRKLLDLHGNVVSAHNIMKVLQKRSRADFSMEQARMVIEELRELRGGPQRDMSIATSRSTSSVIELESFVQLMIVPERHFEGRVAPEVLELRRILQAPDLHGVIERVTKSHTNSTSKVYPQSSLHPLGLRRHKLLAALNATVWACVVASIITLGVSTDVAPTWIGWFALEVAFGAVFVVEVILKIGLLGFRRYVWGPGWRWNWFDFGITVITTLDLTLSLALEGSVEGLPGVKVTMVLRAFRMARIARLVKLLHTPILADLANMLAGFQVGIPCLLWVMVLLFVVFYVVGIILRQAVGLPQGVSRIAECGFTGDTIPENHDPMCQPHLLYGEEFFGTLPTSMFTVFRCVLGDCATEAGKSLTVAFSRGYGIPFDLMYCCGMILVVVGLFNIISAIFVETTISGLKYNNVQRKYARTYESRYVQQRLEALVTRVRELHREAGYSHIHHDTGEFALNEDEFDQVMQDEGVNGILEDLDVAVSNRVGLFDLFDCDNNGLVSISDLVGTLMKIRGEPQKADMIASWVALRSLNDRFQEFERLVLENQKRLLDCQRDMLAK